MKYLFLSFVLLSKFFTYGQETKILSDQEKLAQCIKGHTNYFTFNHDRPEGKGWEILEQLFANNQFVAWGEYHNSPALSRLTAYAMASANKYGYHALCVETSPFVAEELMRISRTQHAADTLAKIYSDGYPGIGTFPFFHSAEDAQILEAANKFQYNIWGVDQEFQMGFSYALSKIYAAQSKKIKSEFKTVYDSLQARWWYPQTNLLDSLKQVVLQKNYKALIEEIKVSKEIYRFNDNQGRALLMKKNFFRYYDSSKNKKVFLKLGSNHLAKGMNLQTQIYDIGNAVYELAQRNGTNFANVYIMIRYTTDKGIVSDDMTSEENENPKVFSALYQRDQWVLVDIRSLHTQFRYDHSLAEDAYRLIEKYDFVLVSPEVL